MLTLKISNKIGQSRGCNRGHSDSYSRGRTVFVTKYNHRTSLITAPWKASRLSSLAQLNPA